jgi:ribosomal-protein-alanine N-acetyltransferase
MPEPDPLSSNLLTILPATWRDLNVLRQVENQCFGKDAWPLLDLIAALTFPDIIRLKAIVDGQMVGFIAGDKKLSDGLGWITTLGVLPEFRRQGIASALLRACEEQLNLPRIRLCVRRTNDSAILLYRRFGYAQVGIWPAYYQDGEDALVLEKAVKPPPPG